MMITRITRGLKTRMICLIAILMCSLLAAPLAMAQEAPIAAEYQAATPKVIFLNNDGGYNARSLTATLYVSDDEIWLSGLANSKGSYLIEANIRGDTINNMTFLDAPGSNPIIQCISKVEDALLLGFIDADNQAGTFGLLSGNGNISYVSIQNSVKLTSMTPTAKGILALGVSFDEKEDVTTLHAYHFNASGSTDFEKIIYTAKMSEDMYYLSSSIGCELNGQYFFRVNAGVPGRLQAERTLICLSSEGDEQWRALLPEGFAAERISASDQSIYLFGVWGSIDENDVLVNRKAAVVCYSADGTEKWSKTFEQPDMFHFGASTEGVCVAASGIEGPGTWRLCTINANGIIQSLTSVEFSDEMHVRGVFSSAVGESIILGTTDMQLFILDLPN